MNNDIMSECCTISITGRPRPAPRTRVINPTAFDICYLCGNALTNHTTRDHVPPKQFFPKIFRQANTTNDLEWLPTHRDCNHSYHQDEDYFVTTFGLPAAATTISGHALGHDIRARYLQGQQRPLVERVINECEPNSNIKSFDSGRTNRIAWKIVRGLHCLRTGQILPRQPHLRGGFTCDQTPVITQQLTAHLHAAGFKDEWEGSLPMIFKTLTLIDESSENTSYMYLLVCWEYLTYFFGFHTKDGQFLQATA